MAYIAHEPSYSEGNNADAAETMLTAFKQFQY